MVLRDTLATLAAVLVAAVLLFPLRVFADDGTGSLALNAWPRTVAAEKKPADEPAGRKNPTDNADKADEQKPDEDKEKNGDKDKDKEKEEEKETWYTVHGQGTVVSQGNWKFRSPYIGPNSFLPILNYRTSETATLFLGARVW